MALNGSAGKPLILIDGFLYFLRCYKAYPSMNNQGQQAGGIVGSLKGLMDLVQANNPERIYFVWESGGNSKRRSLLSDYKQHRRPQHLNRFYEQDLPDTDENEVWQVQTLTKLLKLLPICQIYVKDCEADDVIAFLSRYKFRHQRKIIVSADRDYYQLLDESTTLYNPYKKDYFGVEDVFREFHIATENFALAKAICGDSSDNIKGVRGLGFKRLPLLFPIFASKEPITFDFLRDFCIAHREDHKIYGKVLESMDTIKRNYRLIYLDTSMLSHVQISRIETTVEQFQGDIQRSEFIKELIGAGILQFNANMLFSFLSPMVDA